MLDQAEEPEAEEQTHGRLLSWFLRRGSPTYAGAVLAISFVKYGVGIVPWWNYMQAMAENWRDPLLSPYLQYPASYRLASPTSAVAAGLLGLLSGPTFLGFHFVLACAALVTPFCLKAVRRSPQVRLAVTVLLVGNAIPSVLLSWIGSYDPVTIAAGAVGALAESKTVAALGWAFFAFNNAPQAALALVVYCVVLFVHERRDAIPRIAISCAGAAAGYLGIRMLLEAWGGGTSRAQVYSLYSFSRFVNSTLDFGPLVVLSGLGIGWVFLLHRDVFALPAAKTMFGLALLICVTVPFTALDQTRIVAGILWPPMLLTTKLTLDTLPKRETLNLLRRLAPAAVLLPILVVLDDGLVYAGWQSLWDFLGYIFGGQPIPTLRPG